MPTRILSDGSIQTYGKVSASDLNDIANYYRQHFGVNFNAPSGIIRLSDWNSLRQAILTGAGSAWGVDAPTLVPGIIRSSIWPVAKILFNSYEQEFVAFQTTNVTIPVGCVQILVEWIVGGGGGGGFGTETESGGGGGGGGSGGYYQNLRYNVNSGDTISVTVGSSGGWGGSGGNSSVALNGTVLAAVSGGGAGGNAGPWSGGSGGGPGSPNGSAGSSGQTGWGDRASSNGGNGAAGPFGAGGNGGTGGSGWPGNNATTYGAGGGGGGSWDRNAPYTFHGGTGGGGYVKIKFCNPADAA